MKKSLFFAGIITAALWTARAEDAPAKPADKPHRANAEQGPAERFAAADTDGNGSLSLAEFKVAHEKRMAERKAKAGVGDPAKEPPKMPTAETIFTKLDADGNGALSPAEFAEGGRQGRGPKDRPGKQGGDQPVKPGAAQ